jgi:hypothetical protein
MLRCMCQEVAKAAGLGNPAKSSANSGLTGGDDNVTAKAALTAATTDVDFTFLIWRGRP